MCLSSNLSDLCEAKNIKKNTNKKSTLSAFSPSVSTHIPPPAGFISKIKKYIPQETSSRYEREKEIESKNEITV